MPNWVWVLLTVLSVCLLVVLLLFSDGQYL